MYGALAEHHLQTAPDKAEGLSGRVVELVVSRDSSKHNERSKHKYRFRSRQAFSR
jgi:hypothetical protein